MIIYFAIILFLWLLVISIVLFKTRQHYLNLTRHTHKQKIEDILNEILNEKKAVSNFLEKIDQRLNNLEKEKNFYLQKIGFIRYNPFEEKGDKSFVLALLDRNNSGVLLNYILTPDGLRVYSKILIKGVPEKGQLSDEEKKAIEKSIFLD